MLKRFYQAVSSKQQDNSFILTLDGRTAHTPKRRPLAVPSRELADDLVREWDAQREVIDPARMPVTRLVNAAIDGVADTMVEVRADVLAYAGSDLISYRAHEPHTLVHAQAQAWDPLLSWAERDLDVSLISTHGVVFIEQPRDSLDRLSALLDNFVSPFQLAALHSITTLTGSAVLAMAAAHQAFPSEDLWQAAHVDEFYQEQHWGVDEEAILRRNNRKRDFEAAITVLKHTSHQASVDFAGSVHA